MKSRFVIEFKPFGYISYLDFYLFFISNRSSLQNIGSNNWTPNLVVNSSHLHKNK